MENFVSLIYLLVLVLLIVVLLSASYFLSRGDYVPAIFIEDSQGLIEILLILEYLNLILIGC